MLFTSLSIFSLFPGLSAIPSLLYLYRQAWSNKENEKDKVKQESASCP